MDYKTLLVEVKDRVATVSLNRPDVRNAFHPDMIRELTEAFNKISSDATVAGVLLKGEGKSFCSGADLGYMKSMARFTLDENKQDSELLQAMFWALRSCPHPIVGRLHGHVMGGALGLTALCDVVAAIDETRFCFSEVRLGLAPAVIAPFVLEKMNPSAARRFMLTGEVFSATAAIDGGLVQFAGAEGAVDDFVAETLQAFLASGTSAVRATKMLLRQLNETPEWPARRDLTTELIAQLRVGAEAQEGLGAFFEKRDPSWKK